MWMEEKVVMELEVRVREEGESRHGSGMQATREGRKM